MRYGIFADIHSNLEALTAVMGAYRNDGIDRYLCAGDIVGYASNPCECVDMLTQHAVESVAGNHDRACVDLYPLVKFNPIAQQAVAWTKARLTPEAAAFLSGLSLTFRNNDLTIVHGTPDDPREFAYMTDIDHVQKSFMMLQTPVCFLGHTHVAGAFIKDHKGCISYTDNQVIPIAEGREYLINAGSVGQPRDGNPCAVCCIYDTQKHEVSIRRIGYDVSAARRKILDSSLPRMFGDRLVWGH